ncbi:MAG: GGDEF domain-containing protein [Actinomycetota bacterium]|nr:GGDEF domain-containing protein [Actinomycetota bacterium]
MSASWSVVCIDLAMVVCLVSIAKALSDLAGSPTAQWVWFVGLSSVFVFVFVALPLRSMLLRQRRGLQHATQIARQQAVTDPLTGLLNRRSLDDVVRSLLSESVPFSVSICDLDRFKQLNDSHGHDVGDRALRVFATALRSVVRNGDFVARVGGEEFVIILPDASKHIGYGVLERARRELGARLVHEMLPEFTFSAGVADTSEGEHWDELLRMADQRLLAAKRSGRNQVLVTSCG